MARTGIVLALLLFTGCAANSSEGRTSQSASAVSDCKSTSDCGPGDTCREGACVKCLKVCNMMCRQGSSCRPDASGCMACLPSTCAADADCQGGTCQNGTCQSAPQSPSQP